MIPELWVSAQVYGDSIFWETLRVDLINVLATFAVIGKNWTIYTMHIDVLGERECSDRCEPLQPRSSHGAQVHSSSSVDSDSVLPSEAAINNHAGNILNRFRPTNWISCTAPLSCTYFAAL